MPSHKGTSLVMLAVLVLVVLTFTAQLRSENRLAAQHTQEKKLEEYLRGFPVTNYNASESPDTEKQAKRRAKSRTYNDKHGEKINPDSAVTAAIRNEWESGLASTIPVEQSSAIVIGKVTDAQAYLSEDKTSIYSEFSVWVEDVLKNDDAEPIAVGAVITTERRGGRVRLPSGLTSSFYVTGQNPPQIGRRYVLFLGHNPFEASDMTICSLRDMSRHILTGYELRAGKVFPLDGAGGKGFIKHEGEGDVAFLAEIRRSLAAFSQSSPR